MEVLSFSATRIYRGVHSWKFLNLNALDYKDSLLNISNVMWVSNKCHISH
jgi:hypothetical protein